MHTDHVHLLRSPPNVYTPMCMYVAINKTPQTLLSRRSNARYSLYQGYEAQIARGPNELF